MAKATYKVCVVTVTYGNRWGFLEQVLRQAVSFIEVVNVVVIDNATPYNVKEHVFNDKIIVLNNSDNEGSAGGYNKGIKYAYNNIDCNFIWLLDDDNLPAENALSNLLNHWDTIEGSNNKKALFCFRDDRSSHVKIAMGENPYRYYLVPDNFLGFHIFRIFKNQYYKFRDKFKKPRLYLDHVKMPYVPYGGLLLHKDLIADIGYPDERFFLYVDDSEYSYRITQNKGTIWLIPSSKIIDIDKSQGINYKSRIFHSQLLDQWNFRTYYHVRNRIYFYSTVALKNNFVFSINKALYLACLQLISVISSKRSAYKKLLIAVYDGLNGNLGKANPDKF